MKQWGVDYIAQTSGNVSDQSEWTGWTAESSDAAEQLSLIDWGETLQILSVGCRELPRPPSFHWVPPERPPQAHLKRVKSSFRDKLQYQSKYTQAKCLQGMNTYVAQLPRSCWKDRSRPPCSSLLSVHCSSDSLNISGRGRRGVKWADLPALLLTDPWSKGSLVLFG